ncbi:MAG TPA: oligopeptide/dipeptide ABC transporter ATP-binding protein, partial [Pyrinomonadaceae bacterium]|nr:oligopeptide/dipeptide ABC transporter ATP-binding protein [Pyrinomonadaceae bacterium]
AGKVFERAPTAELFAAPGNPYTKGLLKSVPDPAQEGDAELYQIPGLPPDVAHLPEDQCPFAERCYRAEDICRREFPPFVQLNAGHFSLCHFAEELYAESLAASGATAAASRGSGIDPQGGNEQRGAGR